MDALKAMLVRALLRLCSLLPLSLARALGRAAGYINWLSGGRSRRVTQRNIQLAFTELTATEQAELSRQSLCATGELVAEMGHIWLRPWEQVARLIISVRGAEVIEEALAAGRGVIVLAPHLGNWEAIGLHLATMGDTVSLYETPGLAGLDPVIKRARQRSGARLVSSSGRGLASLLSSVQRGGIAGILPDQVPAAAGSGQNALFMGVPCFTGTLAGKLIRRTGALAVFGVAQRVPGGFALRYEPVAEALYSDDVADSLAALNLGIESCLRRCTAQYQWEYKRFRTRPRTRPGHYDDI